MLGGHANLIRDYLTTSRRQYIERELSDHTQPHAINPFARAYGQFVEAVMAMMEEREIRAWHYCRMTEDEIALLKRDGVTLSTIETLRARLDAQVAAGRLSQAEADGLFGASPLHSSQRQSRSDKYWMVSTPVPPDDSGVELLLGHWGGEVAYFWLEDQALIDRVAGLGCPCVVELAVPVAATRHAYSAAAAIVATYARILGCKPDAGGFDLYTMRPLGPEAIRAVHCQSDESFAGLGVHFPPGSADSTVGDYDELVAEMEAVRRRR